MAAGGEAPAQGAVRIDGVDAVTTRVQGTVRPNGRSGVHIAAGGFRADADGLLAGAHPVFPQHLPGLAFERVEVVVVRTDIHGAIGGDGGGTPNHVSGCVGPRRPALASGCHELAAVAGPQHESAVGHSR